MGITRNPQNSAISTLFSSTQAEVLALLYGQPEREFMGSELIRRVGRGTGAVHRQLKQLSSSGLVTVTKRANQTYYQADAKNPIFPELRGIFLKTVGLAEPLRRALQPFAPAIAEAFIFGSVAAGTARSGSDVDLMILTRPGDELSYSALFAALVEVEPGIGRKVNPIIMDTIEWQQKLAIPDSFAARVDREERIIIIITTTTTMSTDGST